VPEGIQHHNKENGHVGFLRPSSHDSVIVRGLFSDAVVCNIDGKWMNLYSEDWCNGS